MANMKMAHDPNVEILGAPIGDVILCDNILAQMRVKAVPGVGARSTPPSLVSEGLALFDEEVRRYFSDCVAIDASDSDWLQAQLSLSRGGLGLRRLALHCSAAYLASIIKAGCADSLDEFTLQAVTVYSSLVPPASSVALESLLDSGPVKKTYLPELMTNNSTSCASSHLGPSVIGLLTPRFLLASCHSI
ncbi:hypothetical protein EMCRGX_G003708 [Ephydatia muelleri]